MTEYFTHLFQKQGIGGMGGESGTCNKAPEQSGKQDERQDEEGDRKTLENPFTIFEIEKICHKLRNGRACGHDDIPNEFIKYASERFRFKLRSILNCIMNTVKYT